MKVAERVGLELLLRRLVTIDLGQSADVVPLQTAVQSRRSENDPGDHFPEGRSRQVRHRRLERIKTIVQRQQRVPPERDDDRLLVESQHRGFCILRPGWKIGNRRPLAPLGHGLLVRQENDSRDRFSICLTPVARRKRPQARFTILYCSTGCLSRRGAAVKNLSHSASFHSKEKIAPSKSGIKHLIKT